MKTQIKTLWLGIAFLFAIQSAAWAAPDAVTKSFTQEGSVGSYTTGTQILDGDEGFGIVGASNAEEGINIHQLSLTTGIKLKIKNQVTSQWVDVPTATTAGYSDNYKTADVGYYIDYAVEVDWDVLEEGTHTITWEAFPANGTQIFHFAYTVNITALADGSGVTPAVVKPTISTGNASNITAYSATLSGSCSANGGADLTAYGIKFNNNNNAGSGTSAAWSYSANGLSPNTQYSFSAYGTNSAGTSEGSSNSFTTLPAAPSATAFTAPSTTSITANWTAPSGGASGYYLDLRTASGSVLSNINVGNVLTYQMNSLTPGTTYYYKLRAIGSAGTSDNSNEVTAYTYSLEPTSQPGSFGTESKSTSSVQFDVPAPNTLTNCSGYIVIRKQGNDYPTTDGFVDGTAYQAPQGTTHVTTITGSQTTFTDTNLDPGTTYSYILVPFNWDGSNYQTYNYLLNGTIATSQDTTWYPTPTVQASNIRFTNIAKTSMKVEWTRGNGSATALLARQKYAIPANPLTDRTLYIANTNYSQAPTANNTKVLYKGTATSASITGLTKYSLVYFSVYDYNGTPGWESFLQTKTQFGNSRSRWTLRKDGVLAEDDFASGIEASIYPNPASDRINISIDMPFSELVTADLISSDGKLAKAINFGMLNAGEQVLSSDLSELSSGVYLLSIKFAGEQVVGVIEIVK